jgi:hypothetical protein
MSQSGNDLILSRSTGAGAVCERMDSPSERALAALFNGAVRIERAAPNERLLVGKAGSLLLER